MQILLLKKNPVALKFAKDAVRRVGVMTYDEAEDYLVRMQEAANFHDKTDGRKEGIRQFIDEKSYKPGLGAYDLDKAARKPEVRTPAPVTDAAVAPDAAPTKLRTTALIPSKPSGTPSFWLLYLAAASSGWPSGPSWRIICSSDGFVALACDTSTTLTIACVMARSGSNLRPLSRPVFITTAIPATAAEAADTTARARARAVAPHVIRVRAREGARRGGGRDHL